MKTFKTFIRDKEEERSVTSSTQPTTPEQPVSNMDTSTEDALFWQRLELVSKELQTGLKKQLSQNCGNTLNQQTDQQRWENLRQGMILLSVIHLLGTADSKGGLRQILTQLVPESNL